MSVLEIFTNLSIYRVKTENSIIEVPVGITDITALARTSNKGLTTAMTWLVRSEPFTTGDTVMIEGQLGKIVRFNSEYTDIIIKGTKRDSSNIVRINQPKIIQSTGNYTKQYHVVKENGSEVILSGIINDLFWEPNYVMILSDNPEIILKFIMTAQINTPGLYSFGVDEIIFNTKPVLRQKVYKQPPAMTLQRSDKNGQISEYTPPEINLDINTVYRWKHKTTVSSEMSFPLFEIDNISAPRVYFLKIEHDAKTFYGYSFEVPKYIPPGSIRIHSRDFSMIGFSTLEINGRKVYVKVTIEDNLLANTVIETSTTGENRNTQIINFTSAIISKIRYPITLIAEMDFYGRLLESNPEVSHRYNNKLIWYFQIQPGSNNISCKIVSQY